MVLEDTVEQTVDWGSFRAWWRFVGLCVLIAVFLVLSNVALIYAVRLASVIIDGGSLHGSLRLGDPDILMPVTYKVAITLMLLLLLWFAVHRSAGRLARWAVPDDFPMRVLETGKSNNFGWLGIILALNGMIGIALSLMTGSRFSIPHADPGFLTFSAIALFICKDALVALFWRTLAEDRSPNEAAAVRSSWFANDPGRAIAILAAICLFSFLLTAVLARGLAWL